MSKPKDNAAFPKKIGLALGSGSARGWAHIGVIKALSEAGIKIDYVAGTSIGSIVGAALALGKMNELEDFARQLDWKQIVSFLDVTFPRSGIIDGEKLTDFFRSHLKDVNIEDLPLPYRAVATDYATGREHILDKGDLIAAIRASISIPGIFTVVRKDGSFLLDGGLVNPVPVSVVKDMGADYVIAVDLNHGLLDYNSLEYKRDPDYSQPEGQTDQPQGPRWKIVRDLADKLNEATSPAVSQVRRWMQKDPAPNIFDVLTTSINIMEAEITTTKLSANPPDLLVKPRLAHISLLEFNRADETIAEGYQETIKQVKNLKDVINSNAGREQ